MVSLDKGQRCLIIILAAAFFIRLYSSFNIPFTEDELDHIALAKTVCFIPGRINLPVGSIKTEHPLLSVYVAKAGFLIFGESRAGGRMLFVLLSTIGIFFIYRLAKETRGAEEALLSASLLALSQYHIGFSRLISDTGLMLFFCPLILYLFYKLTAANTIRLVALLSFVFGIGYWANEILFFLIPVFLVYAYCDVRLRYILRTREFYLGIAIIAIMISPSLYWNFQHGMANFRSHLEMIDAIGAGLISLTLYLGEIFSLFIKRETLALVASVEHAFMNWLLGLACLISALTAFLQKKDAFISLMLLVFWVPFIFFSLIKVPSGLYMDNHWWAQITLFPGVILCSMMLLKLKRPYRGPAVSFLLLYLLINSLYFASIQQNNFIPAWAGIFAQ